MSAPSADFPALGASTSSSGYCDGLGRRALAFDREDGTMLERLVVRAELSAFERSLRDRLERLAGLDDERLARPRSIERSHDGALVVLSEFVPGSRLSDLLDSTAYEGTVPGVDVALGFLLDVLPALCGLHAGAGFAHGAISAGRTVLTPAGQVVLLDGIFGEALSRLKYSRRRLWAEFGVAMPPTPGPPRFDASCDIAQTALAAVMLVIGRPIAEYEYPEAIPSLLVEVVDVAQIRGSSEFAAGLQRFLQRSLPLPGTRPYTAVDDALIDVRDLARALGVDVCRRALVDFIEQQEAGTQPAAAPEEADYSSAFNYSYGVDDHVSAGSNGEAAGDFDVDADGSPLEMDVDLDGASSGDDVDTFYDLNSGTSGAEAGDPLLDSRIEEAPENVPVAPVEAVAEPLPEPVDLESSRAEPAVEPASDFEAVNSLHDTFEATPAVEAAAPPQPPEVPAFEASAAAYPPAETGGAVEETSSEKIHEGGAAEEGAPAEEAAPAVETAPPAESETTTSSVEEEDDEEQADTSKNSRRRKRARSARSRKDKLRSTARPQPLAPAPPPSPSPAAPRPAPAPKPTSSGWLVEPSRAASFEPQAPAPTPPPEPPPRPAPIVLAPPPPPPLPAPLPPPPPQAVAPPPPMPRPVVMPPSAPIPVQRTPVPIPPSSAPPPAPPGAVGTPTSAPAGLKLKTEPPAGYAPPRKPRNDAMDDVYSGRAVFQPRPEEPSAFPWKIAGGALVLIVVGAIVGASYLTGGSTPPAQPVPEPEAAAPPVTPPAPAATAKTGRVQITTEPSGARVLLDGKHVGESPLTLEVPAGRHTFTVATSSDSVRRTVRVEAGKTLALDVPIFSGFIDIVAPIILDVAENGKSIGTTENPRQILRPGKHVLTLSNRDLDYTTVQTVEIEPGEVKTLTIDPRGTANLNATPWAEVWMDGKKIGDTPLANVSLPLGTHELVFKYPGYAERRTTITVRANSPIAVSVDMKKQ